MECKDLSSAHQLLRRVEGEEQRCPCDPNELRYGEEFGFPEKYARSSTDSCFKLVAMVWFSKPDRFTGLVQLHGSKAINENSGYHKSKRIKFLWPWSKHQRDLANFELAESFPMKLQIYVECILPTSKTSSKMDPVWLDRLLKKPKRVCLFGTKARKKSGEAFVPTVIWTSELPLQTQCHHKFWTTNQEPRQEDTLITLFISTSIKVSRATFLLRWMPR